MRWKILSTILVISGFSLSGQLVQWVVPMSSECMFLLNFRVVLGFRNFGLFQVLILFILHFIWTCLFVSVSFGVPVAVVPATRSNNHKENLLQPAGPGQNQSVQEAISENQICFCSKTILSFYARWFFFSGLQWRQPGWTFTGIIKATLFPAIQHLHPCLKTWSYKYFSVSCNDFVLMKCMN